MLTDRLGVSVVVLLLALAVAVWPVVALPAGARWPGSGAQRPTARRNPAAAWSVGGCAAGAAVAGIGFGWPIGVALALVMGTLLLLSATALRQRRERSERAELGVVLGVLGRELRAGTAGQEALEIAAVTAGDALGRKLRAAMSQAFRADGRSADDCAAGWDSLGNLVSALRISDRHGVPPADLVEVIAGDVARAVAAEEVRIAQTAGPRFSGFVLGALPLFGVLLGTGIGADPVAVLLGGGAAGSALLVVGTALVTAGLLWSARIVAG
ncbi:hypothetical protein ABLG96_04560 [Nakamurella sp. A5-74]|uniref:Type II secretion system protein GspF domain-containing protein n=1 Tax=Nakamurella sp. A5-74 TaxID=3158264 RepID=A0AAU8DT11_9ACTN